jgi:alpha-L-rhamnosidase
MEVQPEQWMAKWIGAVDDSECSGYRPVPILRTSFDIAHPVESARVFMTGLGYFMMTLNGEPVSDHCLDPVVTRYDKRVAYLSFDLLPHLRQGENVAGFMLGNGWFNNQARDIWHYERSPWRAEPRMLCQIELTYADGSSETVVSDSSWRWHASPIVFNCIRNGEYYDARLEIPGWNLPGFDDADWRRAVEVKAPGGRLYPQQMPPIRVIERLDVKSNHVISDQLDVYDFGRNTSGWTQIEVRGKPGASITLRYSDRLKNDGRVDLSDIQRFIWSGDAQTDRYIIGSSGRGVFKPSFMYHGFQYVEVDKSSDDIEIKEIFAEVAHTDLPKIGHFECSNGLLNQIYECTSNSFLTNYHSYPTDCPHREKLGWMGDGQLLSDFGLFNFDMNAAYLKWLDDMADEQQASGQLPGVVPTSGWGYECTLPRYEKYKDASYGPQWEGVSISLPWKLYLSLGDSSVLKKYYPMMQAYYRFLESWSAEGVLRIGIDDHQWIRVQTNPPVISTAYYHMMSRIMEQTARVLNQEQDAGYYARKQVEIRDAFNRVFLKPDTGLYDNGDQCAQALALAEGLVPVEEYENAIAGLVTALDRQEGHPIVGVVGLRALTEALPMIGRSDLLYKLLNKTTFPSIGHWIEQGATTLWQRWDGTMSRNHVMFGSVCNFFFKHLAGIQPNPARPGYRHFFVRPVLIEELDFVSARHECPYGTISVAWERETGGVRFSVEVPTGTSATVEFAALGCNPFNLEAGRHEFVQGLQSKEMQYGRLAKV